MEKREYRVLATNKNGEQVELIFRPHRKNDYKTAKILYQSWSNPQNRRFNIEINDDGSIEDGIEMVMKVADRGFPTSDGVYYMVIETENNGQRQVVGDCWFGNRAWDRNCQSNENESWGFGYGIIRSDDKDLDVDEYTVAEIDDVFKNGVKPDKNWGKGYATAIIGFVFEQAKIKGVKDIISSADILNYGSLKPMFKKGMRFYRFDDKKYPNLIIHLNEQHKEYNEEEWKNFQEMLKKQYSENKEQYEKLKNEAYIKEVERQQKLSKNKKQKMKENQLSI